MEAAATTPSTGSTMITLRATDAANLDKEGVVLSFKTADALPSKSSPVLKKLERREEWNILHPKVEAQEKLATLSYVGGYLPVTAPVRIQHGEKEVYVVVLPRPDVDRTIIDRSVVRHLFTDTKVDSELIKEAEVKVITPTEEEQMCKALVVEKIHTQKHVLYRTRSGNSER